MIQEFQRFLEKSDLSGNTVSSYVWTVSRFLSLYGDVSQRNLQAYKDFLLEHYKPQTVNIRLQAINKYLDFTHKGKLKMRFVKVQQKSVLENVISNTDYRYLKRRLKADGKMEWYFVIWFMGATGARVSELLKIKAEHVAVGHMDLYSKGGKMRRLYFPERLRKEAMRWLSERSISTGPIFLNRFGAPISARGIALQLKYFARKYGIDPKVVYPHSFRHLFAKNFLERCNDISFLADLMGHGSIETTRIYLRRTEAEQRTVIDTTVTW